MPATKYIFLCLFITGCATTQEPIIKIETREVKIPVPVACKIVEPTMPATSFELLDENSTIFDQVKSLLSDRILYKGHIDEIHTAFKECKNVGVK